MVLAVDNSFHGRTYGSLSLTAQEKYRHHFAPWFRMSDSQGFYDSSAGGGVQPKDLCAVPGADSGGRRGRPPPSRISAGSSRLLQPVRLSAGPRRDSVRMGRTGKYFAYQHYGIEPDLVTIAKSLAAGYPLGAVLGHARVADSLKPGDHGTTFGGGPLACRLALEFLDIIQEESLLERVGDLGRYLMDGLRRLAPRHPSVGEVRESVSWWSGTGCRGETCRGETARARNHRQRRARTVLRLLPPYIISRSDIDEFS